MIWLSDVGLMLGERRRRWTNIRPTSDKRLVSSGLSSSSFNCHANTGRIPHVAYLMFDLYSTIFKNVDISHLLYFSFTNNYDNNVYILATSENYQLFLFFRRKKNK